MRGVQFSHNFRREEMWVKRKQFVLQTSTCDRDDEDLFENLNNGIIMRWASKVDDVQSPLWSKSVRLITKPLVRGQYYHLIEAPLVSFKNIRVQVMSKRS